MFNTMIKFRVWDKSFKKMDYEGNYALLADGRIGRTSRNKGDEYFITFYDQDRYIVMLASPFIDIHGRRIFDGDIIIIHAAKEPKYNQKEPLEVKYQSGVFIVKGEYIFSLVTIVSIHQVEIVGNIYMKEVDCKLQPTSSTVQTS